MPRIPSDRTMANRYKDDENVATMAKPKPLLQRPPMYTCLFINDDYTPMGFVVEILISIFNQSHTDAQMIMLKIHEEGRATVGVYPREIANHKADETLAISAKREFPLQVIPTPI